MELEQLLVIKVNQICCSLDQACTLACMLPCLAPQTTHLQLQHLQPQLPQRPLLAVCPDQVTGAAIGGHVLQLLDSSLADGQCSAGLLNQKLKVLSMSRALI